MTLASSDSFVALMPPELPSVGSQFSTSFENFVFSQRQFAASSIFKEKVSVCCLARISIGFSFSEFKKGLQPSENKAKIDAMHCG